MILQALVEFYESMAARGEMPPFGWMQVPVSYLLCINAEGELTQVIHTTHDVDMGKKKVTKPVPRMCPAQVTRTVGVESNFLCDHSGYLLGVDNKGKPKRSGECFDACRELHHAILDGVDSEAARAVLAFLDKWDPKTAKEHPALKDQFEDVISGGNLLFYCEDCLASEDPVIAAAWNRYYSGDGEDEGYCLVTGKFGAVERTHPQIRGVVGAQSSGAAIVSFNAPAFASYGKEQNLNAPTGKYASFAYTSALNYLVKDADRHIRVGDTTVLFWMNEMNSCGEQLAGFAFDDDPPGNYTKHELWNKIETLVKGDPVEYNGTRLDPQTPFYILGISPNAARLSVRFFYRNTFGYFLKNVWEHQERLQIAKRADDRYDTLPIWKLLSETVNEKSKDKSPSPNMAGDVLRSVLTNTPYPATLMNGVTLRIRAEREITRGRAAIIRAYYLKNTHPQVPKEEVLSVSLKRESNNVPYCLGRLFAVLEKLQNDANGASTVKDHYFVSAAATPASIFTILFRLSKSHLKKLGGSDKDWLVPYYEKLIREIMEKFGEALPTRLTLAEQGSFQLGYYHQNVALYQKKEDQ